MGRGRQKAKQRKVARNLKYATSNTDYEALERELKAKQRASSDSADSADSPDDYYDDYEEFSLDNYEIPPATD